MSRMDLSNNAEFPSLHSSYAIPVESSLHSCAKNGIEFGNGIVFKKKEGEIEEFRSLRGGGEDADEHPTLEDIKADILNILNKSEQQSSWSNRLFGESDREQEEMSLFYVTPLGEEEGKPRQGKCESEDVSEDICKLQTALIGFFLGSKPGFNYVKSSLEKQWKTRGRLETFLIVDGSFLFEFSKVEDWDRVVFGHKTISCPMQKQSSLEVQMNKVWKPMHRQKGPNLLAENLDEDKLLDYEPSRSEGLVLISFLNEPWCFFVELADGPPSVGRIEGSNQAKIDGILPTPIQPIASVDSSSFDAPSLGKGKPKPIASTHP
ncbi:hypothetical protein NE237_002733 [Protea cynaroides]|uniref:DUF4283 domain-containing protein n=1 Tax=Protea cynaroides TaxID=273540 RepID=A0A9Q0KFR0_9MAGN|nr:hypothetical protein NE237_002733 [Protea cynaroides]